MSSFVSQTQRDSVRTFTSYHSRHYMQLHSTLWRSPKRPCRANCHTEVVSSVNLHSRTAVTGDQHSTTRTTAYRMYTWQE